MCCSKGTTLISGKTIRYMCHVYVSICQYSELHHFGISKSTGFIMYFLDHAPIKIVLDYSGKLLKKESQRLYQSKKEKKNVMRDKTFCHMNAFYKFPDEKPWKDQCWDVVLAVSNVRWRRSYDIEGLTYWATILKHIHWWFVIKAWYMQGNR